MPLTYDPAEGQRFWDDIRRLPGYPRAETIPIQHMLFQSDALFQVSNILEKCGARKSAPLLVVMDETPMRRSGQDLKSLALALLQKDGWQVQPLWMRSDSSGQVHTDLPHIRQVQNSLLPGCALLSIGSGVVTDIAKHGSFLYQQESGQKIPYVVYPTANSVSAYTSNMAPTLINGVKRTLDSRYPDAVICDLETLRDAPLEMTLAGAGDMLAAFVSLADWHLAHRLGMDEQYSELPKRLLGALDELLLAHAAGIRRGEMEAVAMLAKLICLGGLAMSLSHATTPLSGFEHVMSHVLDLQAERNGLPLARHGLQVALATVASAGMYRRFLLDFEPARLDLDLCYPDEETMRARIERSFASIDPSGQVGAECWADYRQKLSAWHAHRQTFTQALTAWPALRQRLDAETCSPEKILRILEALGAPLNWSQLQPPVTPERARFAFLHAAFMRKRLTLGDLLIFTNWNRERVWDEIWRLYPVSLAIKGVFR